MKSKNQAFFQKCGEDEEQTTLKGKKNIESKNYKIYHVKP